MNRLKETTAIALVLSLPALNGAHAFTPNATPQINVVSQAYLQSMAAQQAAGRAASQVTIAPHAYVAAQSAQAAAGRAASQVTIAPPAYLQAMAAQQAAARAASQVTIAPQAYLQSIAAQQAAAKTASQVTIASPAYMTTLAAQAAAAKTASQVTIAPQAYLTTLAAQAAAAKAASQVTMASAATKLAQNVAAAMPTGLLIPGKAMPDYGPYSDAGGGTPNPTASLTDLQPATDQTFANPTFANGLTNMPFGQPAAPLNAATLGSIGAKVGAAGNGQSGFASTVQNGVTAAANAAAASAAANTATLALLGSKIGGAFSNPSSSPNGLNAGTVQSAISAAAAAASSQMRKIAVDRVQWGQRCGLGPPQRRSLAGRAAVLAAARVYSPRLWRYRCRRKCVFSGSGCLQRVCDELQQQADDRHVTQYAARKRVRNRDDGAVGHAAPPWRRRRIRSQPRTEPGSKRSGLARRLQRRIRRSSRQSATGQRLRQRHPQRTRGVGR